ECDMAKPLMIAGYHDAVIESLKKIGWVRDADAYPERTTSKFTGLVTPAVYFTINGWDPAANSDGQLNVELSCDLFVIVDSAGEGISKPEIF
ncbi:hypothetical protein, partial [Rheinheimera hassiensis]|uniref:hypothetical protein n=1 Tax=Rheinheimera hassiensis TaxID=1193627 RepID=UPI001F062539